MGAKSSKSELTRRKSFTNLGRSSQRSLFQKHKTRLNRIAKQIDGVSVEDESIRTELDQIDKELDGISETVKLKNQEKYEEIRKHLDGTRKKYEDKFQPKSTDTQEEIQFAHVLLRNTPISITNILEDSNTASVEFSEVSTEAADTIAQIKKHGVKFGVQVLPPSPELSQALLKRKTYPVNSSPKTEATNRNTTDGCYPRRENGEYSKSTVQSSNSFNLKATNQSSQYNSILTEANSKSEYLKTNLIFGIDAISNKVNDLETKLKYFTGGRESKKYIELHEGLVNNLAFLESLDTYEDSIAKQEQRILRQRIQELLKILECLVENDDHEHDPQTGENNMLQQNPRLITSVTAI